MNSPLFNALNPNPMAKSQDPLTNFLGNMPGGSNALARVQQLMQATQQSPEQIVKGMLQSGRITQDQFNQAAQMANMLTGRKF